MFFFDGRPEAIAHKTVSVRRLKKVQVLTLGTDGTWVCHRLVWLGGFALRTRLMVVCGQVLF